MFLHNKNHCRGHQYRTGCVFRESQKCWGFRALGVCRKKKFQQRLSEYWENSVGGGWGLRDRSDALDPHYCWVKTMPECPISSRPPTLSSEPVHPQPAERKKCASRFFFRRSEKKKYFRMPLRAWGKNSEIPENTCWHQKWGFHRMSALAKLWHASYGKATISPVSQGSNIFSETKKSPISIVWGEMKKISTQVGFESRVCFRV